MPTSPDPAGSAGKKSPNRETTSAAGAAMNPADTGSRFLIGLAAVLAGAVLASLPFDNVLGSGFLIERLDALSGDLTRVVQFLEIFGHGTGLGLFIVGLLVVSPASWRTALRIVMAWAMSGLFVNAIKSVVFRYRPKHFFGPDGLPDISAESQSWIGILPDAGDGSGWHFNTQHLTESFPSGHSATAMVLAIWLSWLCPRGRFLFVGVALVACMQRVLAHAHWPSDVFAGAAVGVLAALLSRAVPLPGDRKSRSDGSAG